MQTTTAGGDCLKKPHEAQASDSLGYPKIHALKQRPSRLQRRPAKR